MKQANLTQIRKSKDGRWVGIEQDLLDILVQIKAISPALSVKWSNDGEFFAIYENGELVFTTQELDQRVVDRLRFIGSEAYSFQKALDQQDREREKKIDHKLHEEVGERGERLAHALRKDLQYGGKAFVPKEVK